MHRHYVIMRIAITSLRSKLYYAAFGFLDHIDSTCPGLTDKRFSGYHLRGEIDSTSIIFGSRDKGITFSSSSRAVRQATAAA